MRYDKFGEFVYLLFNAINSNYDNNIFVIEYSKRIMKFQAEESFRLDVICFFPKEKGYETMAKNFGSFQKAIEQNFVIRKHSEYGTENFRADIFISEPLDLECDNERQLYVMKTRLTFINFDYNFIERK